MIEYYAVFLIVLFSMFVMLVITYSDKMLPPRSRKGFMLLYCTLIILSSAEWLEFFLIQNHVEIRLVNILIIIVMFSIAPIAPMVVISSIGELRFDKIYKVLFVVNLFIQTLSAKFGFIYYIDEESVYHRGDYYFIYIISFTISLILLFISLFHLSRKYQHQSRYILFLIGVIMAIGITIQMIYPRIYTVWLSMAIGNILLYIYFYTLIAQNDSLTVLLNRRCYENQIKYLRKDAIIVFFDVNDFKGINDSLGHPYGDYCLQVVARRIRKVYSSYGTCYRIGGDEFCVILTRHLVDIDELNKNYSQKMLDKQKKEASIPSVSVGYGIYSHHDQDVSRAIDKADKMMYMNKEKNRENKNHALTFYI